MKKLMVCQFLVATLFTSTLQNSWAEPSPTPKGEDGIAKSSMQGIYQSYKELQPYILDSTKFFDESNKPRILELVSTIQANFHTIDKFDKKFRKVPAFATNVSIVKETLEQISKDMKNNPSEYDLKRLKGISRNCATCHSTYKPEVNFHDTLPPELQNNLKAKAEFLMATRQFTEAEKALFDAAIAEPDDGQPLLLLRQWLVIQTRIYDTPDNAVTKLQDAVDKIKNLHPYEEDEIGGWLRALAAWKKDSSKLPPLAKVKQLLRVPLSSPEPFYTQIVPVDLLRASGILHRGMSAGLIKGADRGEALYLLGFIYSKLPLFFIDELPEIYFEECIRENPNTQVARSAYALYKDFITLGYTGSGGTHIPGAALAKLDDLYRISLGIPIVQDRL